MKSCKGCKHYKKDERTKLIVCEFDLHESYCEKDKEDFAIEELERIKEEIYKEIRKVYNLKVYAFYKTGLYETITIIDKHIAELKGENKQC